MGLGKQIQAVAQASIVIIWNQMIDMLVSDDFF